MYLSLEIADSNSMSIAYDMAIARHGLRAFVSPKLERPALHAKPPGFIHSVSFKRFHFTFKLPPDMQRALAALRGL